MTHLSSALGAADASLFTRARRRLILRSSASVQGCCYLPTERALRALHLTHTSIQRAYPRTVQCRRRGYPLRTDASCVRETSSKTCRSSRPDLTVGLEAFYNHVPLSLVLEEVTEE